MELFETSPIPSRSFLQWLEENGRERHNSSEFVTCIKQAEIAFFRQKLTKERWENSEVAGRPRRGGSPLRSRLTLRSRYHALSSPEQDFTTKGTPGKLGCPFASLPTSMPDGMKQNLPTPRTSLSNPDQSCSRWRRASLVDPLRARTIPSKPMSPEESIAEEEGPACPIRFMGQHTPEDIANYVQAHKSEMPTSHGICVQRFKNNETNFKELDAKYDSLVSMIQDLGQKHQAVLAEAKATSDVVEEDEGPDDEDHLSEEKVKAWATTVTIGKPDANEIEVAAGIDRDISRSEVDEGGRLSHFDRPLREIRVGESPSRPWGVPIPAKFLDRTASGFSVARTPAEVIDKDQTQDQATTSHAARVRDKLSERAEDRGQLYTASDKAEKKCPFDHTAMLKNKQENLTVQPITETLAVATAAAATNGGSGKAKPASFPCRTSPALAIVSKSGETKSPVNSRPTLLNYGTAIVADPSSLDKLSLTNHGTLILGYDQTTVHALLAAVGPSHPTGA